MLCVTMMIVTESLSSWMSSSIRMVDWGSSELVGSSMSSTSASTASARAIDSRCCWPPEMPEAGALSRSLTSSHRAAWRSERSATSSSRARSRMPTSLRPATTLS